MNLVLLQCLQTDIILAAKGIDEGECVGCFMQRAMFDHNILALVWCLYAYNTE